MKHPTQQLKNVDINRIRLFMTIVECGGFSGAQQKLDLSAASVSLHMTGLEEQLETVLCNRGRSGFWLTPEGKRVYKACQDLMHAHDRFNSAVGEAKGQLTGDLRLGVIDNSVFDDAINIPKIISRFNGIAPDVQISLYTLSPSELEEAVLAQQLHLAVGVFYERSARLNYQCFCKENLTLYCGQSHPLYSLEKSKLRTSKLKVFDFVERTFGTTLTRLNKPIDFKTTAYASSIEAALLFILSGNYIGFLPRYYAQQWINKKQIKPIFEKQLFIENEVLVMTHPEPENAKLTNTLRKIFNDE